MAIHSIDEKDFDAQVAKGTVLIDFSTSWCPPCRALLPVLKALAAEGVEVRTIDAEENRRLAERYDVRAFPTVIAFQDGQPRKRIVGLTSKEKLRALL
jgi:thioredoxin 1